MTDFSEIDFYIYTLIFNIWIVVNVVTFLAWQYFVQLLSLFCYLPLFHIHFSCSFLRRLRLRWLLDTIYPHVLRSLIEILWNRLRIPNWNSAIHGEIFVADIFIAIIYFDVIFWNSCTFYVATLDVYWKYPLK